MDIKKLLGMLKSFMENEKQNNQVVVKTIIMNVEYKKKWTEIQKLSKKLEDDMNRLEALRKNFWSSFELENNEFRAMFVNEKEFVVEIFDEKEVGKSIVSPIQIKRE